MKVSGKTSKENNMSGSYLILHIFGWSMVLIGGLWAMSLGEPPSWVAYWLLVGICMLSTTTSIIT